MQSKLVLDFKLSNLNASNSIYFVCMLSEATVVVTNPPKIDVIVGKPFFISSSLTPVNDKITPVNKDINAL